MHMAQCVLKDSKPQSDIMTTNGVSTLCNYIHRERVPWSRVQKRLETHPKEARQLDAHGRFPLNSILSRSMQDYPSAEIVEAFIQAYPPVLWYKNNSPLEIACWRRAPLTILQVLIESRPCILPQDARALNILWSSYQQVFERQGMKLVDFTCQGGREAADIWTKLYLLLRYCTDPCESASLWRGLHLACGSQTCSFDLFQIIWNLKRSDVSQANEKGQLPLHCLAASGGGTQALWRCKLQLLLDEYPNATRIPNDDGYFPIHLAVMAGCPVEFLNVLMAAAPETLGQRGGPNHFYPFQLAAISPQSSVSVVYHLLRAAPHLLVDNVTCSNDEHQRGDDDLNVVATKSNVDAQHSFTDLLDIVRQTGNTKDWTEMLNLLRMDEGQRSTPYWTVAHAACSITTLYPAFLELAVHLYPQDLRIKDEKGGLPLHVVSSLDPNPFSEATNDDGQLKINIILDGFSNAARVWDDSGSLPLHKAICAGQSWSSLSLLIRAAPETLCRRDGVNKLYPFQLAACSPAAQLNELYQLLVSSPNLVAQQNR